MLASQYKSQYCVDDEIDRSLSHSKDDHDIDLSHESKSHQNASAVPEQIYILSVSNELKFQTCTSALQDATCQASNVTTVQIDAEISEKAKTRLRKKLLFREWIRLRMKYMKMTAIQLADVAEEISVANVSHTTITRVISNYLDDKRDSDYIKQFIARRRKLAQIRKITKHRVGRALQDNDKRAK